MLCKTSAELHESLWSLEDRRRSLGTHEEVDSLPARLTENEGIQAGPTENGDIPPGPQENGRMPAEPTENEGIPLLLLPP